MSKVTISLPDAINATMESRANAAGFRSKEEYLLALVQADCERAELEPVLEARLDGPFEPLELDWKQRVRDAAQRRG
jgi:Arc/MetJ-type ribon-helix-helix transcriptional regulator